MVGRCGGTGMGEVVSWNKGHAPSMYTMLSCTTVGYSLCDADVVRQYTSGYDIKVPVGGGMGEGGGSCEKTHHITLAREESSVVYEA